MTDVLISGVLTPLILGLVLSIVSALSKPNIPSLNTYVATAFVAIVVVMVYILLEGVPPFPPVSSKQKLGFILACGGLVAVLLLPWFAAQRFLITFFLLLATLVWIGFRKFSAGYGFEEILTFGIPVLVFAAVGQVQIKQGETPYLWPITLLVFAFAASFVFLTGGYIGMAQLSGAIAAFIGGYLLLRYGSSLIGNDQLIPPLPVATNWFLMFALATIYLSALLFAPKLNVVGAFVVLLVLLVPLFSDRMNSLSTRIQPVVMSAFAMVPGLIAVLISFFN